jgi:hypothetical protein
MALRPARASKRATWALLSTAELRSGRMLSGLKRCGASAGRAKEAGKVEGELAVVGKRGSGCRGLAK